jgi:hypothetical protein
MVAFSRFSSITKRNNITAHPQDAFLSVGYLVSMAVCVMSAWRLPHFTPRLVRSIHDHSGYSSMLYQLVTEVPTSIRRTPASANSHAGLSHS